MIPRNLFKNDASLPNRRPPAQDRARGSKRCGNKSPIWLASCTDRRNIASRRYQRGGWIQYVLTPSGPEPFVAPHSRIDYEHYLVKQLPLIANAIFQPLGDSFVALTSAQKALF